MNNIIYILLGANSILLLVLVIICIKLSLRKEKPQDMSSIENMILKGFSSGKDDSAAQYDRLLSMMLSRLDEVKRSNGELRDEVNSKLLSVKDGNTESMKMFFSEQQRQTREMEKQLLDIRTHMANELERIREENRAERESSDKRIKELSDQVRFDMDHIREDNEKKLDEIRTTVSDKLEKTLDSRLSKSFEQVSRNLDSLYQAIGEINKLSKDVGDLNKLFGNVKSRGVWGEVQIDSILSDILTPEQYERNFHPRKGSAEVVEFAIRLPGRDKGNVYIPVDSKFPKEDYERYVDAQASGDMEAREISFKALRDRVRHEAQDVSRKYINPPVTTDFAILFVPTESLYAELLRIPGYIDDIQSNLKVIISGPTTFSALVTSLQMGFRTLQIEKKTKEVWHLFAQIKKQMEMFTRSLDDTQAAIDKASMKISDVIKRHHRLSTKLGSVELPEGEDAGELLIEAPVDDIQED